MRIPLLTIALASALLASPTTASDVGAARRLAGLQAWLDSRPTLRAEFRQTLESGALGGGLEESGELRLARPGRMRWEYVDPERKLAIVDGHRSWLWIEDDRQLILARLDDGSSLLPRLLASGIRLADHFEAFVPPDPDDGGIALTLVPRQAGAEFREVDLVLAPGTHAVREARVVDAAGNRMRYRFTGWRPDPEADDTLFRFDVPADAEVLGTHDP